MLDRETKAPAALRRAMAAVLEAHGGDPLEAETWSIDLERSLTELGFQVAKDYHSNVNRTDHGPSCYHCGRPENTQPFVIPGTPLELRSSEGDAGRWRHWGGSDMWICRVHPNYMDGDHMYENGWERTLELDQALEHAAARDGLLGLVHTTDREVEQMVMRFEAEHAERLAALDAAAPNGGHQGRARREGARSESGKLRDAEPDSGSTE